MIELLSKGAGQTLIRLAGVLTLLIGWPQAIASNAYDAVANIFEQKCIACHACYDAPCQLNLQGIEGLQRGASKLPVYNGARLKNAQPTRLYHDGHSITDWRRLSFFPVISDPQEQARAQASNLMQLLVAQGHNNPLPANQPLPEGFEVGIERKHFCPTTNEVAKYLKDRPLQGMPYGVTGLTDAEFKTMQRWFDAGSPVPEQKKAQQLIRKYAAEIEAWERFFNQPSKKQKLLSRYLYEHLFLGHLYLSNKGAGKGEFFKLVRSRTSGDEPIKHIITRRPNDDPQGTVYYRLMPITESIVHKNHITYPLTEAKRERFEQLFFSQPWNVETLPGYDYLARSNPFLTFADIPAKARYQFMLDNAEYFTRNFIRGPVCHGPVATAVIRDHFWTLFEDPDYERYVNDHAYREKVSPLLGLPGQKTDVLALGSEWLRYQGMRNEYLGLRQVQYREAFKQGAVLEHIWDGDKHNPNAYLTVFRHHDNAAVMHGLHGRIPRTLWVMDYPLLERGYYELVVGFDVFGSVSHQAQTRLYFDLIRNGAEQNFLRFMPMPQRERLYDNWYRESGKFKILLSYQALDTHSPVGLKFHSKMPKDELANRLLQRNPNLSQARDTLNRCDANSCDEGLDVVEASIEQALRPLTQQTAKSIKGILNLPNLSFLRVELPSDQYRVYSLVRNRAHSNVAFILGEDLRYLPEEDTLSVVPFIAGSYPNFMFRVNWREIQSFAKAVADMQNEQDRKALIDRWGIRRTHPDFWALFHGFKQHIAKTDPKEAGVFDMNRYHGW
ncbi:MAG: fatty acid cis/trans isomerase [Oleiphilaceae bacterium]|nr:fatty acid cis/trans isomerase [Oleiphilaceae bacterium]